MFYIYHGPDELMRSEAASLLLAERGSGDPDTDALNTVRLDGDSLTLGDLEQACSSFSLFQTGKRLVLVTNCLTRLKSESSNKLKKEKLAALTDYLAQLPESTDLIFVESSLLVDTHPVIKMAAKQPGSGYIRSFAGQRKGGWSGWVVQRVKQKGAAIEPAAARMLAEAVGDDPKHKNAPYTSRVLDSEINKLIAFVGDQDRKINENDIRYLVPYSGQANIFAMVDAIGLRDSRSAFKELYRLHEEDPSGNHPLRLFGMIVRQFRILIQVKELSAEGVRGGGIGKRLKIHSFVAEKAERQARNFSMRQLETIYSRLLETDLAIKTGRMEGMLALETLVATLCGSPE